MLTPQARVYLAVNDPWMLEGQIGADGRFTVLGSGDGEAARRQVTALEPDCVILDAYLRGADGLALLKEWRQEMAAPPRVLLRCPTNDTAWRDRAQKAGADRAAGPEDDTLPLLSEAAFRPLPALAEPWEGKRREIAAGLMKRLGVPEGLKGRHYMAEATAALCCAPQMAFPLAGRLYPYLAERFKTTPGAAERAIRTAVESTWLTGDLEGIQALFGMTVDAERGKPTNGEFLCLLGEHARREMKRWLWERRGS